MDDLLKKVILKKIELKDFVEWLKTNKSSLSELSSVENSEFIPQFINFVKEKCIWLSGAEKSTEESATDKVNSLSPNKTARVKLPCDSTQNQISAPSNHNKVQENVTYISVNGRCDAKTTSLKENYKKRQVINLGCTPYKQKENYSNPKFFSVTPDVTDFKDFPPLGLKSNKHNQTNSWNENSPARVIQKNRFDHARSNNHKNLNVCNSEAFPPLDTKTGDIKARRRITPTPIQATSSFSAKFGKPQFSAPPEKLQSEAFKTSSFQENVSNLQQERELLKATKNNILKNSIVIESTQSSNYFEIKSNLIKCLENYVYPEPDKITLIEETMCLAEIYSCLLCNLLVPNVTAELYFLLELITSKVVREKNLEGEGLLSSLHDCVYFSVCVLCNQYEFLQILDKATLTSLKEIPYLLRFSPQLVHLLDLFSLTKSDNTPILPSLTVVPFQIEEDSRANFPDEYTFICFKKQRDLFYEMLREWQENIGCVDAKFQSTFLRKARQLISINSDSLNMYHLARLFQSQLITSCMFLEVNEVYDELLSDIQKNFPDKFKKLQERLLTPSCSGELTSSPSFFGIQIFFAELIISAGCFTLNQHLINIFVSKILELNSADLFSDGDLTSYDTIKDKYIFHLHTLRLLGKFLGYLYFLPYSKEVFTQTLVAKQQLAVRQNFPLPLSLPQLLKDSINRGYVLVTVPWIVEFLSMVDSIGKELKDIQESINILIALYHNNIFQNFNLNSYLFLTVIIGWLLEVMHVQINFFTLLPNVSNLGSSMTGIDKLPVIDKQLIHSCCPFLIEFKVNVYNFLNGIRDRKREVRKITPLSTKSISIKSSLVSMHQMEHRLEENFFFLQPSSVKKTTEFVAERMASRIISKIRSLITSMKLNIVEDVANNEKAKSFTEISDLNLRKKCIDEFLLEILNEVYKSIQNKISDLIKSVQPEICSMIPALLSDDTKSTVSDMCCKISFRMSVDKILDWCNANLLVDAIKTDIRNKVQHMSRSESSIEPFQNLNSSIWLSTFRNSVFKVHKKSYEFALKHIEELLSEMKSVITHESSDAVKKTIFLLSVDFYIALLINYPDNCCNKLANLFIQFWTQSPKTIVLEKLLINPQNFKFLLTGKNIELSQRKFISLIKLLLELRIISQEELSSSMDNLKKLDCSVMKFSKFFIKQIDEQLIERHNFSFC